MFNLRGRGKLESSGNRDADLACGRPLGLGWAGLILIELRLRRSKVQLSARRVPEKLGFLTFCIVLPSRFRLSSLTGAIQAVPDRSHVVAIAVAAAAGGL